MNYTIMLGEVKGDVDKKWQPDLKELFEAAFSYLNRVFKKSLKSPPSFRKEEIQGVFVERAAAYLYYRQLKMLLFPLSVRIGLGEGKHYQISSETFEGPAYFHAERALALARAKDAGAVYVSFRKTDKYLNAILLASEHLERRQSLGGNLVRLFSEIYFPLYKKNAMEFSEYGEEKNLLKALRLKEKFFEILLENKRPFPEFMLPKLSECKLIDLEALYAREKEELVSCFWERGFCTKIAASLKMSRQNVSKHLDSGIIFQRNLEGSAALFLTERK